MIARRIRDFFDTLFRSELVLQLRADLEEARHERDHYKSDNQRLVLLITQPRVANRDLSHGEAAAARPKAEHGVVGGRPTWAAVIAERRRKLTELAKEA